MVSIFDKINQTPSATTKQAAPNKPAGPEIAGADKTSKPMSLADALGKMKGETTEVKDQPIEEVLQDEIPDFDKATGQTGISGGISLGQINSMAAPETLPKLQSTAGRNIPTDPITAEIGDPPPVSATPEEVTQYYLDKLTAAVKYEVAGRETLKELHFQLAENPDTKELLLPEHLGMITTLMDGLTGGAHNRMTTKKAATVKKRSAKAELEAEVASDLDLGDLDISL